MIPSPPPAEVRQVAREILRRPEFARWRAVEWEGAAAWFKEWLEWVLEFLAGTAPVRPIVYLLFWGTLILLMLLLSAHVIWTLRSALRLRATPASHPESTTPIDLSATARDLAGDGRFLEASRCLYLACLDRLLQRGLLELSRSEPNRTLRRRLRQSSLPAEQTEELCRLLDRTETAWFRTRREEPELYEGWMRMLRRIDAPETA